MNRVRTSNDSPINLGFLPGPGRVGLTIAPGKRGHSKSGPRWKRDIYADLGRLRAHFNIEVVVCLLEDQEIEALRIPKLLHEVEAHGMTLYRLPIPDGGVLSRLEIGRAHV